MEKTSQTRAHMVFCLAVFLLLFLLDIAWGAEPGPGKPSKQDKCPVCGMFVYKYPDWVAEIIFKDGKAVYFDGPKDMFKYYFNLKKYDPKRDLGDIARIHVSEYYELKPARAEEAFFVIGSDVYGPMGRELIPLTSKAEAEQFKADHKGESILEFKEVTPKTIEKLD